MLNLATIFVAVVVSGDAGPPPDIHGPPPRECEDTPLLWRLLDPKDSFLASAVVAIVTAPIAIPYRVVEDGEPRSYLYEAHAYAEHSPGLLRFAPKERPTLFPTFKAPPPEQAIAWQAGGERWLWALAADGALLSDDRYRGRLHARLFTPTRVEVDGEAAAYHVAARWASVSALHINYRFAQSPAVQFRVGLGGRFHTDADNALGGFDLVYGFDAFIVRPLVLSASASMGTAGSHFVTDLRAALGVVFGRVEARVGYEQLVFRGLGLSGPVLGARVWL